MENILKNTTSKNRADRTKTLLTLGAVSIGSAILAFTFIFMQKETPPVYTVTGLAEGYTVEAIIENRAGTKTVLSGQSSEAVSLPYRFNASLKLRSDSYRDFIFMVNEAGSEVAVIADGFHSRDLISVRMNGETVLDKIPADWSGRLQLYAALPDRKSVTACVDIAGKANALGMCHTIVKGASS